LYQAEQHGQKVTAMTAGVTMHWSYLLLVDDGLEKQSFIGVHF